MLLPLGEEDSAGAGDLLLEEEATTEDEDFVRLLLLGGVLPITKLMHVV